VLELYIIHVTAVTAWQLGKWFCLITCDKQMNGMLIMKITVVTTCQQWQQFNHYHTVQTNPQH